VGGQALEREDLEREELLLLQLTIPVVFPSLASRVEDLTTSSPTGEVENACLASGVVRRLLMTSRKLVK
jgi:hypothetical protein